MKRAALVLVRAARSAAGAVHRRGGRRARRRLGRQPRPARRRYRTVAGIPAEYLQLFQAAGARYGVPWEVLAGIGKVECDDGQDPDPSCTQEGAVNYAGAGGPMQFLASTWAAYGVSANGDGSAGPLGPSRRDLLRRPLPQGQRRPAGTSARDLRLQPLQAYVEEVLRWAAIYETKRSSPARRGAGKRRGRRGARLRAAQDRRAVCVGR